MTDITLQQIDALLAGIEDAPGAHWEGCEREHVICAAHWLRSRVVALDQELERRRKLLHNLANTAQRQLAAAEEHERTRAAEQTRTLQEESERLRAAVRQELERLSACARELDARCGTGSGDDVRAAIARIETALRNSPEKRTH